jgi:hypothetical protein
MMLPPPRAIIAGIAALTIRNAPVRLMRTPGPRRPRPAPGRSRAVAVGGAVHEHVEPAETLDRGGDGVLAARAVGDVEMNGESLAAARLDLAGRGLGAGLLDVGARDASAGGREGQGGGPPDPVRGADHDGGLLL